MGAWFSAEEAPEATSPAPSPCKSSPPQPERVLARTVVQADGAHAALAARALPHTWPHQAPAPAGVVWHSGVREFPCKAQPRPLGFLPRCPSE